MRFFASPKYSTAIMLNTGILFGLMLRVLLTLDRSLKLTHTINHHEAFQINDEKLAEMKIQRQAHDSQFKMSISFALLSLLFLSYLMIKNFKALDALAIQTANKTPRLTNEESLQTEPQQRRATSARSH